MQRSIRQPVHTTAALLLPSSINNHTHSLAAILIQEEKKKKNLSIPFASPVPKYENNAIKPIPTTTQQNYSQAQTIDAFYLSV